MFPGDSLETKQGFTKFNVVAVQPKKHTGQWSSLNNRSRQNSTKKID